MTGPAPRGIKPIERMRRVHIATALLAGIALALLLYGPPRAAVAVLVLVVLANLWSLEMLRAAIRNPEILR